MRRVYGVSGVSGLNEGREFVALIRKIEFQEFLALIRKIMRRVNGVLGV
jgi:hypothetical protein